VQGGLIVGAFQESVYDQGEIDLRPGDRLVTTVAHGWIVSRVEGAGPAAS